MPRITFLPADVTVDVPVGTTVFNAAARAEVAIPSQCGGKCACALCRVELVSGESLVDAMGWEEEAHLGNAFWLTRERLSCQLRVFGDVVVRIAQEEVKEKVRGRYIPRALVAKRERMERDEEQRRARSAAGPMMLRETKEAPTKPPSEKKSRPRPSSGRRDRRRKNPGAPRSGDSRPPPGAKKKED